MQSIGGRLIFSASDLNNFLECAHLSELERRAALGELLRPEPSPSAALLAAKGQEHERRYLQHLRERFGDRVLAFEEPEASSIEALERAHACTVDAMAGGAEIIYQATFFDGQFVGRTDFLRKIPASCERWPWSYEVIDTKLAHSTKPYFLVQLCNYAEHIARVQGTPPTYGWIVPGSGIEQRFLLSDYAAYYRHLKQSFFEHQAGPVLSALRSSAVEGSREASRDSASNGTYPHEVSHCQICRWSALCQDRRDKDDYLGLVALMRRDGIRKLQESGIATLTMLANATPEQRPAGMKEETFVRLHDQARLQHRQRTTGELAYELLPFDARGGLALLPQPDPGDVFFDMEGDPLYTAERGLEYLFGAYLGPERRYLCFWAKDPSEERRAFEALVDFIVQRRREHPAMHVYHYAPYETTALKRLSGRYASREEELDDLLRAQVFVDLYAVVRQGLRISQSSYSIKKLEPFYGFARETATQRGDDSILAFETWLVEGDDNILVDIENYNRDDCISTLHLRNWLVERRAELCQRDGDFPWRPPPQTHVEQEAAESDDRASVREQLLRGLDAPETAAALRDASEPFRARWLLGHLLDYHRRDEKPAWWQYFYRCENRDELIEFDREAIGGLRHCGDIAPYKHAPRDQNFVHVYEFPEQQHMLSEGDGAYLLDTTRPRGAGTIVKIDEDTLQLHLKVSREVDPLEIDALTTKPVYESGVIRSALLRVARSHLEGRLECEHPALYDLLLARKPRLRTGHTLCHPERGGMIPDRPDDVEGSATQQLPELGAVALSLDSSYLFVQGPPGSGKSTRGAGMIVDLIAAGKSVAVLANTHKAIHNLLHKIEGEALRREVTFRGIQRYSSGAPSTRYESALANSPISCEPSNAALAQPHDLAAGTAWVFCREELIDRYDYLVIDEAGQVSLANAIACAPCARNIVLLGDPLQLAQVSRGTHPVGAEASVLEHLLGDAPTVPPQRGIFLDRSYRMHPGICAFISDAVYAGRLRAADGTSAHRVDSPGFCGSGLRFVPIDHVGNSRESPEEAASITHETALLLQGSYQLAAGVPQPLTANDILIVTPYNAQRRLIAACLREDGVHGIRVGTVDKFQGQQAPVVIYSMATSSGDDLPRGVGFLFERNRFNVAISRAQCLSVLVCSPRLLEVSCSTPEQMALVNLLCAFAEAAR